MDITNVKYWIGVVFVCLVFSIALLNFGSGLNASDKVTLSNKSVNYLNDYSSLLNSKGLSSSDIEVKDNVSNPLSSEEDTGSFLQDVFAVFNKIVDTLASVWNYIVLVFSIPSFIVQGLGLPLGSFKWIIDLITWTMLIAITIVLVRLAK